jgi:hypothetical protein
MVIVRLPAPPPIIELLIDKTVACEPAVAEKPASRVRADHLIGCAAPRDTPYSAAVFDLDAGPVTGHSVELPKAVSQDTDMLTSTWSPAERHFASHIRRGIVMSGWRPLIKGYFLHATLREGGVKEVGPDRGRRHRNSTEIGSGSEKRRC